MFVSKQQQVQQLLLWGLALPIVACINLRVRVQLVQQGGLIEAQRRAPRPVQAVQA